MCTEEQSPEDSVGSPGGGVTGNCEPSDVGAGNQAWVLCKSGTSSPPLNISTPNVNVLCYSIMRTGVQSSLADVWGPSAICLADCWSQG